MKDGTKRPQPLRANEFPLGMANLSQSDQQRVFLAKKKNQTLWIVCAKVGSGRDPPDHRISHQFTDVDLVFFTWAVAKVIFVNMYACAYGSACKAHISLCSL